MLLKNGFNLHGTFAAAFQVIPHWLRKKKRKQDNHLEQLPVARRRRIQRRASLIIIRHEGMCTRDKKEHKREIRESALHGAFSQAELISFVTAHTQLILCYNSEGPP